MTGLLRACPQALGGSEYEKVRFELEKARKRYEFELARVVAAMADDPADKARRAALAAAPPANLIYASCDFDSFARDSHELLAGGRLSLMAAEGYVFLPYTEHLETLAHFTRRSPEPA